MAHTQELVVSPLIWMSDCNLVLALNYVFLVHFELCLLYPLQTLVYVITQLQVDKGVILLLHGAHLGSCVEIFAVVCLDVDLITTYSLHIVLHSYKSIPHQVWALL